MIRPTSKTFINGIAGTYEENLDDEDKARLKDRLSLKEYTTMMEKLNDHVSSMFPCLFCWIIGYVLIPLTLGLSLCFPWHCIKDAEESLNHRVMRNNRSLLQERGITMVFVKRFSTSWIELRITKNKPGVDEAANLVSIETNKTPTI